jgi:hypothetical protein
VQPCGLPEFCWSVFKKQVLLISGAYACGGKRLSFFHEEASEVVDGRTVKTD